VLSGFAALLLVMFGGVTDRLIPLFAVGAFSGVHAVAGRHGGALEKDFRKRRGAESAD